MCGLEIETSVIVREEEEIKNKMRFHRDLNSGYWIQSPMS